MPDRMHRIALERHIAGAPQPEDFRLEALPIPALEDGRFLVRNIYVSADPGTRSRLSPGASYAPPLAPGATVDGFAIGRVQDSRHPRYPVGALVAHGGGWATHALLSGRGYCQLVPDLGVRPSAFIGILGIPGMTAWFGLRRVAAIAPRDSVLVTSAAGPVGATAGQLARRMGAARLVGLAGSEEKRRWLTEVAGFHAALDYRSPTLEDEVRAAMPDGIDILFDNVGNALIDRMLPQMRLRGRIVVSGQVADYNRPLADVPGLRNTREFIARRLRMEGLVVFDDLADFAPAQQEMARLLREGLIHQREIIGQGLDSLPLLFCGLFDTASGSDFGRRIAHVGEE